MSDWKDTVWEPEMSDSSGRGMAPYASRPRAPYNKARKVAEDKSLNRKWSPEVQHGWKQQRAQKSSSSQQASQAVEDSQDWWGKATTAPFEMAKIVREYKRHKGDQGNPSSSSGPNDIDGASPPDVVDSAMGETSADSSWVEVDTDEATLVNGTLVNDRVAKKKGTRIKNTRKLMVGLEDNKKREFNLTTKHVAKLHELALNHAKKVGANPPPPPNDYPEMSEIGDDYGAEEWFKVRNLLADGHATVAVGETSQQPLVVSDVGTHGHEGYYIGANTSGMWRDVGDKECTQCGISVNELTQFAYFTEIKDAEGKSKLEIVKHFDADMAKVQGQPVSNLAADVPGAKASADTMTKEYKLVCVLCAGLMNTHPQHFHGGKCKLPVDFIMPSNPYRNADTGQATSAWRKMSFANRAPLPKSDR